MGFCYAKLYDSAINQDVDYDYLVELASMCDDGIIGALAFRGFLDGTNPIWIGDCLTVCQTIDILTWARDAVTFNGKRYILLYTEDALQCWRVLPMATQAYHRMRSRGWHLHFNERGNHYIAVSSSRGLHVPDIHLEADNDVDAWAELDRRADPVVNRTSTGEEIRSSDMVRSIYSNQAKRPAQTLAVLGEEILIEYDMPNGTTALNVLDRTSKDFKRAVSYRSCPKKWLRAIREQSGGWTGMPQVHGGNYSDDVHVPFPDSI